MFRISNTLVGLLNIFTLLLSLAAMIGSAYVHYHRTDCLKVLQYPLLFGAAFVFVVSVLGISGSLCRINAALYAYLLVTFFVICGFVLFTVLALFVTNKDVGDKVSGKGFGEYRVADFSMWLQQYVINDPNWDDIRSCLVNSRLCRRDVDGERDIESDVLKELSTIQYGCCKPPVQCGFKMKNATYWVVPKTGPAVNNSDCTTWNNREDMMCYNCNSCKGGVLANIRKQWRNLTIFNGCILVLLTTIYILGCYAIRNNRYDNKRAAYHRYRSSEA